jgi:hypothetical protein
MPVEQFTYTVDDRTFTIIDGELKISDKCVTISLNPKQVTALHNLLVVLHKLNESGDLQA